jgi:hypothetical protein
MNEIEFKKSGSRGENAASVHFALLGNGKLEITVYDGFESAGLTLTQSQALDLAFAIIRKACELPYRRLPLDGER